MRLKNLIMSASILTTFGMASFAHAADFPVTCASNDGGQEKYISISNNTKTDMSELSMMCDTQKGHYDWTISITAGTQNQKLSLDDRCKISKWYSRKSKVQMTVNHEVMSTVCNWPAES